MAEISIFKLVADNFDALEHLKLPLTHVYFLLA